jgi:hypothetical protein
MSMRAPDRKRIVLLCNASQHLVSVRAPASAGEDPVTACRCPDNTSYRAQRRDPATWHRSPPGYGVHQIPAMWAHPAAQNDCRMDPALYAIRINGHLGATLLSAFPAMVTRHQGTVTVLTGVLDQPALYGVLAEIEALGLDLLEVRQLPRDESEA